MVNEKNCINYIIEEIPGFKKAWEKHIEYWEGESPGLYSDISEFSKYIISLIRNNNLESLQKIFILIEHLLTTGDDNVKNAMCTNCLENILNSASDGSSGVQYNHFATLLGKNSIEFCRAYNKFTGIKISNL